MSTEEAGSLGEHIDNLTKTKELLRKRLVELLNDIDYYSEPEDYVRLKIKANELREQLEEEGYEAY